MALKMPAEHGAWGILIVPFLCAAALAGPWNVPLLLTAIACLGLFILRGSIERQGGSRRLLLDPSHFALFLTTVACGLALFSVYHLWRLILLGHVAIPLYALQKRLARNDPKDRKEKRSLWGELAGVVLLTLSAPAAWIAVRGGLDRQGLQVWLLNLMFFLGGVLYVKYRVRGIAAHHRFEGLSKRLAFAWPVLVYHLMVLAFVLGCTAVESLPVAVTIAFLPGVIRANALLLQLGQRFPIKRLGWTEVVHSIVFAMLLVITFRA